MYCTDFNTTITYYQRFLSFNDPRCFRNEFGLGYAYSYNEKVAVYKDELGAMKKIS